MSDRISTTQYFDLDTSLTFNKKDANLVEKQSLKVKFAKGHEPSREDMALVEAIYKWCLVCEQKGTSPEIKEKAKVFLKGWIDEL